MKALSIRQPWAWLILNGGKTVENRTWCTNFRGEFLIHAAKGCETDEYTDAVNWVAARGFPIVVPPWASHERGGLVGVARLSKVIQPGWASGCTCTGTDQHWHIHSCYGFALRDVRPLRRPIPFRGMPGFFEVDDDLFAGGAP